MLSEAPSFNSQYTPGEVFLAFLPLCRLAGALADISAAVFLGLPRFFTVAGVAFNEGATKRPEQDCLSLRFAGFVLVNLLRGYKHNENINLKKNNVK